MNKRSAVHEFGDFAVWVGILLMAASLPLSLFGLSLGQFIIAGGWLLGGNIKEKIKLATRNPVVWILWGVYFWLLIGLWNTTNFHFATDSLRIKLPLFLLPLFFSSIQPLTLRQYRNVLAVFIGATLISTIISLVIYLGWTKVEVHDIRDIVIFLSHIRLALMICFCVIACFWFNHHTTNYFHKVLLILLIIWFIAFLVLLQSLTGLFILSSFLFLYIIYKIFKKNTPVYFKLSGFILVIVFICSAVRLYNYVFTDSVHVIHTEKNDAHLLTKQNREYTSYYDRQDLENGNPVWININEIELDSVWRLRTGVSIYDHDHFGTEYRYALIRFLASKNLYKDAEGLSSLSNSEIDAIQKGATNVKDLAGNMLEKRIRDLAWEYRFYYFTHNPSSHSFTMRLEFWKTGMYIFKQHLITGVGTGDLQDEYDNAYITMQSKLDKEWRLASHNEYLRIAVLYGIPGLLFFVFSLIFPFIYYNRSCDILYCAFLFTVMCSMISEDTLETQTGVTFFAFFNTFLLFHHNNFNSIDQKKIIKSY